MGSNTATTETWLSGASISALVPPPIALRNEPVEFFPYAEAFSRTQAVVRHPRYEELRTQAGSPPDRPLLRIPIFGAVSEPNSQSRRPDGVAHFRRWRRHRRNRRMF